VIGKAVLKVPGGKLLKVTVEHEGEAIKKVKISGDFFIHPEEVLDRLEERLKGITIHQVRGITESELSQARLFGVETGHIVKTIWEAYG
jgi:lipoate---protein ligase